MGHLGYDRDTTPNLDRLAAEGVTFLNADSAAPWTIPSHASMFTATFPSYHQADQRIGLLEALPAAAEIFSEAGYFSGAFTTHFFLSETFGFNRGFHTFHWKQDAAAGEVVDRALSWLQQHANRPTFLFLHLFDPHWHYSPPPPYARLLSDPDYDGTVSGDLDSIAPFKDHQNSPAPEDLAHIIALYDGEIRYVDTEIGRLMEGIRRLGLSGNTLLVITADHGEEFRDHDSMGHDYTLFEEVLHVPLILYGPLVGTGGRIDVPVRTVDILPTLLELLDVPSGPLPADGGVSLVPLLAGERNSSVPPAFGETRRHDLVALSSMRVGNEKIIWDRKNGRYLLFDLANDPKETRDLSSPDSARLVSLREEMTSFFDRIAERARARSLEHPGEIELSEKEVELLRSLGYLN